MKKLIALALIMLLLASAACAEGPVMGGWTPSEDPVVTEELKNLFAQGTAALTGAGYIPVAYLGSQEPITRSSAGLSPPIPDRWIRLRPTRWSTCTGPWTAACRS